MLHVLFTALVAVLPAIGTAREAESCTAAENCKVAAPALLQTRGSLGRGGASLEEHLADCASTYEAENAALHGVLPIVQAGISGTGYADFQNAQGDYIEWNVSACQGGTYNLTFTYALGASTPRPLELLVNGVTVVSSLNFGTTSSWSTWLDVQTTVQLPAGPNTIKLLAVGSSGGNFDTMTITSLSPTTAPPTTVQATTQAATTQAPTTLPPTTTQPATTTTSSENLAGCVGTHEAEDATLYGVIASVRDGLSGTGFADFQQASGDYIEWSVGACQGGDYNLAFTYALGVSTPRPLDLLINGVTVSTLAFGTTSSWQTWLDELTTVQLVAGTNTIKILAIGSSGGNFDKLTVTNASATTSPPTTQAPTTLAPTTTLAATTTLAPTTTVAPTTTQAAAGRITSSVTKSSVAVSCSDTMADLDSKGASKVTDGTISLYLGYKQVTSINQDPVLLRFDNGVLTYCNDQIETTGDDGVGMGLLWHTGSSHFYAVCTSKGTQNDGVQYQQWTAGGWIPNFFGTIASSNNVKVSVVLRVDLATGIPTAGTFVGAILSSGAANTCVINEMGFSEGNPVFMFDSWYGPVDEPATKTRMVCTGSSPLPFNLKLSQDLTRMLEACGNARLDSSSTCTPTNAASCPSGSIALDQNRVTQPAAGDCPKSSQLEIGSHCHEPEG